MGRHLVQLSDRHRPGKPALATRPAVTCWRLDMPASRAAPSCVGAEVSRPVLLLRSPPRASICFSSSPHRRTARDWMRIASFVGHASPNSEVSLLDGACHHPRHPRNLTACRLSGKPLRANAKQTQRSSSPSRGFSIRRHCGSGARRLRSPRGRCDVVRSLAFLTKWVAGLAMTKTL
jgi:hypothetical protein